MATVNNRHMLQSKEWAEFQRALGKNVIERSGDGWSYEAILEKGDGTAGARFKRLYTPYGPYAINEEALRLALEDLHVQAKELRVDYTRVEPTANFINISRTLKASGYHKAPRLSQPDLTLQIDLTRDFDDLILDMTKTNRYLWRKAPDNHLHFTVSYDRKDLKEFLKMQQETSARSKAIFHDASYYETMFNQLSKNKNVGIAYGYHKNEPLVSAIFIDDFDAKTRYYMYAGSYTTARKYSANSPLLVYLMHEAQKLGLQAFDMFGVSPIDQPNHRWAGFSKFKRSFGGTEEAYNGTWERPTRRIRYYSLVTMRKLSALIS